MNLYRSREEPASTHTKKRVHWKKTTIGQARQKITMDSFINRVKSPLSVPPPEEGGRATTGVDSNTVMSVISGSLHSRDVCVGDVIQVDTDIGTHPQRKRARTDCSMVHTTASCTLEYDKRVADS